METRSLAMVDQIADSKNPLDLRQASDHPYRRSEELLRRVRRGKVQMEGIRADQSVRGYEVINPDDVPDLYLVSGARIEVNERTGEDRVIEIVAPYGLRSLSRDALIWKTMRFSKRNVMDEWPPEPGAEADGVKGSATEAQRRGAILHPPNIKRARRGRLSADELRGPLTNFVQTQREAGRVPTQDELYKYALGHFPPGKVARAKVREFHQELLPDAKQGRRPKSTAPKG